jgi:cysteine desulfurase/selenocysteine lyase
MMEITPIRKQFPQLTNTVNGKTLIYFDSGATSYKPQSVIDKTLHYYRDLSVNVHRALHPVAESATVEYENTRDDIKSWLNAHDRSEIIFTRGTTESINLVSHVMESKFSQNDEIVLTISEHHSNLVPWQILAKKNRCKIKIHYLIKPRSTRFRSCKKYYYAKNKTCSTSLYFKCAGIYQSCS